MTEKEMRTMKRDSRGILVDLELTLQYSLGLLEDYKKDLASDLKEITKLISQGNKKRVALKAALEKINIKVTDIKKG